MTTTTKTLKLSEIRIDGGTQPREAIEESYVTDLATESTPAKLPPLTVFFDGVCHWLADGFHRYHALKMLQVAEFPCEIINGTKREAIWYSLGANKAHGLKPTQGDKRRAVMIALADTEWSGQSSRALAEHIGVSHALIQTVKSEMSDASTPKTSKGKDGKTYQAKRTKATAAVASDETDAPEPVVTDGRGKPITDTALAAVFTEGRRQFKILTDAIADALRIARSISDEPFGAELRLQRLETDIKNAQAAAKAAVPFALCPYMPDCERGCKCCRGKKWITESQWNAVPEELRQ